MKLGTENILHNSDCNLPEKHIKALLRTAKSHNTIIGLRPVNPFARDLIEAGCPTKPLAVKNKSVTIGVAAGFIVINPDYSQLPKQKYKQHRQWLNQAFQQDKDLVSMPCLLSAKRIQALQQIMGDQLHIHYQNNKTLLISWLKGKTCIQVLASKLDQQNDQYLILDLQHHPVHVLGKKIRHAFDDPIIKPLTADYDLLVLCPDANDYNPDGKDKTLLDVKGGNWNLRTREIIDDLNDEIAESDPHRKGKNLEVIHHGSEFHNPFGTPLASHLPCLMIFPEPLDLSPQASARVILVETTSELKRLRKMVQKQGYYWPAHARYSAIIDTN